MRFRSTSSFCAYFLFLASTSVIDAEQGLRKLSRATNDCTIMAAERLALDGKQDSGMVLGCEMHPDDSNGIRGISLELAITETQRMDLEDLITSGNVSTGRDSLSISGNKFNSRKVYIHHGIDIQALVIKNNDDARRNLSGTTTSTGTKSILLVKVIDSGGLTVPDTPEFMSNEGKTYNIHLSLSLLLVTYVSNIMLHLLRIHSPYTLHHPFFYI